MKKNMNEKEIKSVLSLPEKPSINSVNRVKETGEKTCSDICCIF